MDASGKLVINLVTIHYQSMNIQRVLKLFTQMLYRHLPFHGASMRLISCGNYGMVKMKEWEDV